MENSEKSLAKGQQSQLYCWQQDGKFLFRIRCSSPNLKICRLKGHRFETSRSQITEWMFENLRHLKLDSLECF